MVEIYLLWVILHFPKSRFISETTLALQHAIMVCQTIIVSVFWTVLAPADHFKGAKTTEGFYDHVFPLLFILHEVLVTYGRFTWKGELIACIIYLAYLCLNTYLAFVWDIIVYKTPLTNPKVLICWLLMPVAFGVAILIGRGYRKLKGTVVGKLHARRIAMVESKASKVVSNADKFHI